MRKEEVWICQPFWAVSVNHDFCKLATEYHSYFLARTGVSLNVVLVAQYQSKISPNDFRTRCSVIYIYILTPLVGDGWSKIFNIGSCFGSEDFALL